jgi:general secretion pathway protein G
MRRATASLLVVLLLVGAVSTAGAGKGKKKPGKKEQTPLQLLERIPRDPLLVWVMRVEDPRQTFDNMLAFVDRFASDDELDEVSGELADIDEQLGCSLRDDLLASLGPEVALTLDLPPIDELAAMVADPVAASQRGMSRLGLLVRVRDHERIGGCLESVMSKSGVTSTVADGLTRVQVPLEEATDEAPAPTFDVFYGVEGDVMAMGFAEEWVRATLDGTGEKLHDGADFGRVFSHLDPAPFSLTYLNLPRLRELVETSAMLQGRLQASAEVKPMVDFAMSDEFLGIGIGASSVEVDDGVRTTTFGPSVLGGGTMSPAIVAAIAIPNMLNAIDRGKQKRTMADIRSIGTVFEAYAIDNERYPATAGLAEVQSIADEVEPVYIRTLPLVDGWGNSILIASNGQAYVIVSAGKDGELEADWNAEMEIEPHSTSSFTNDIVFGSGQFLIWPEGEQD